MIKVSVRFGDKKSKTAWNLEEAPELVAVRTVTRQPLERLRFKELERREILNFPRILAFRTAGVEVYDVETAARRNQFRKSLSDEPDVRFAGRTLRVAGSTIPVIYTENFFIKFTDNSTDETAREIAAKHGLIIARPLPFARNAYFLKAPEGIGLEIFKLQDELYRENAVEICHPELISERRVRAANPNQWHLKRAIIRGRPIDQHAHVEEAWADSVGAGVRIAVIDDGFDLNHPEFISKGKIVAPRDVTRKTNDPRPGNFDDHGTACAGVACADGVGSPGASGVAPAAHLMPIRLASVIGSMEEAEAFYHAARNGADVISCSWGPVDGRYDDPNDPNHQAVVPLPPSTRLAIDYCIEKGRGGKGCVITWAAGNGNESADNDGYAAYERVIAVAACNDSGVRSNYSDFGACIWCAFPSNEASQNALTPGIWTTDRRGAEGYNKSQEEFGDKKGDFTNDFGGTSSACPGAAGVAALILSVNPNLRWDEVKQILADTADKIDPASGQYDGTGRSPKYGFGRLNAANAVKAALARGGQPRRLTRKAEDFQIDRSPQTKTGARESDNLARHIEVHHEYLRSITALTRSIPSEGAGKISLADTSGKTFAALGKTLRQHPKFLRPEDDLRKKWNMQEDDYDRLKLHLEDELQGYEINIDAMAMAEPSVETILDLVLFVWGLIPEDFKQH